MKEILKKIGLAMTALAFVSIAAISAFNAPSVNAAGADIKKSICTGEGYAVQGDCNSAKNQNINNVWEWVGTITGWILTAVGAVCVIFIIIGGVKYATSGGDADKVKGAKNTLLYALIGLAVALLANVIMNLIVNALKGEGGVFS